MTTATLDVKTHEFDVEDIEYLRHGDKPLLARVFRPRGEGPFPAVQLPRAGSQFLVGITADLAACKIPEQHRIGIVGDVDGIAQWPHDARVAQAGAARGSPSAPMLQSAQSRVRSLEDAFDAQYRRGPVRWYPL